MELIYDRTQADVNRVKELAAKGKAGTWTAAERTEWLAGMKGAYTYKDFNRVESAVAEIAGMLGVTVNTVTNWKETSVLREADTQRYLGNIRKLRTVCQGLTNTPATPESLRRISYVTANNIEKIIGALADAANLAFRSGELYSGEV